MKSNPLTQTSCKNCIFAIYEGNTQTQCMCNRLEKYKDLLIEAYDNEKEFYVIDKKCNLFRPPAWNNSIPDIEKARKEISLTFDLLVDVNNLDESKFNNISKSLLAISYPREKYNLIFCHDSKSNVDKQYVKKLYSMFSKSIISVYFDKNEYIESIISKTKNIFHILLDSNNINNINLFLHQIDSAINDDMKKFVICQNNKLLCISNIACRILYQDLYFDSEKNIKTMILDAKKENLFLEF